MAISGHAIKQAEILAGVNVIRAFVFYLLAQPIANTIAAVAIIFIPFALMGQWPPREFLICSSIGGALSPLAWKMYRQIFGYPDDGKIGLDEELSRDSIVQKPPTSVPAGFN